jgi:hypothetical protein
VLWLASVRQNGGTRRPQRVGKVAAALPPDICGFGDLFPIVFGEADRPLQWSYLTLCGAAASKHG